MAGFTALGFDPAPGDLGVIESLVDRLSATVQDVDDSLTGISGGDDAAWIGKSGDAFRATLAEDFQPQLRASGAALRDSRDALRTWAVQLAAHQLAALRLEEEAADARSLVATRAASADQKSDDAAADDAAPDAAADAASASAALLSAQGALQDVLTRARELKERVDQDASVTASSLISAQTSLDGYQESGWSSFWGSVGDVGEWLMDNVVPMIEDLLRLVAPIISIAAIFFPALAPLALGIAIALVAIDGLQALTDRGSWGDFAVGVVGLAVGAAGGAAVTRAFGPSGQIPFAINVNRMMPAVAGGGAAAGSLAGSLSLNFKTMMSNAYWLVTSAKDINDNVHGYYDEVERHS